MKTCEPLNGLQLDAVSEKTIEIINSKKEISDILAAFITLGVFSSIFTKSKPPQAGFNITQTDWSLYAKAMESLPVITNRMIQSHADDMVIHYHMHNNPKLLKFWLGVSSGCK